MSDNSADKIDFALDNNQAVQCKPFLKWVGGKGQLLSELKKRIPKDVTRYYEPFVGGGALFFSYRPKNAYISDMNAELINTFCIVRDHVEELIKELEVHKYEAEYFYKMRNLDRDPEFAKLSSVKRAARLIYLNKTCFNGLYRVNSKGFFNTPIGKYTNPRILDADNLRACSEVLQNVEICVADFCAIEERITKEDFVYFDPPYVPLNITSNFTGYHSAGFNLDNQRELFELCCRLNQRRVRFMLSNSSSPFILDLYKQFQIERVSASRAINSVALKRGKIEEVVITNYL